MQRGISVAQGVETRRIPSNARAEACVVCARTATPALALSYSRHAQRRVRCGHVIHAGKRITVHEEPGGELLLGAAVPSDGAPRSVREDRAARLTKIHARYMRLKSCVTTDDGAFDCE